MTAGFTRFPPWGKPGRSPGFTVQSTDNLYTPYYFPGYKPGGIVVSMLSLTTTYIFFSPSYIVTRFFL